MADPTATMAKEEVSTEITVGGCSAWVYQRKNSKGERGGNYYVKGNVPGGGEFFRSTGFSARGMAIEAGKKLWKARLEGRLDALDATKLRKDKPMATIGQIVQAHALAEESGELDVKGETALGYRQSLIRIIAWAKGWHEPTKGGQRERIDTEAVLSASGALLADAQTIVDFVKHYLAPAGKDILVQDARLRTVHSLMRDARAMFGESNRTYRALTMPDLKTFLNAPLKRAEPVDHAPLTDRAMQEMAKAALKVKVTSPALYLVHLLFRHLGMRNDEIEEARVEWIERFTKPEDLEAKNPDGSWKRAEGEWRRISLPSGATRDIAAVLKVCRRSYWKPKRGSGVVAIAADVLAELEPFLRDREASDYLVSQELAAAQDPTHPGTARKDLIYRAHSDFVRPWTADAQKTSYELRRWGATTIGRLHQSVEMPDRFLRHAKRTTAEKHYLTELPLTAPLTLADVGL